MYMYIFHIQIGITNIVAWQCMTTPNGVFTSTTKEYKYKKLEAQPLGLPTDDKKEAHV